MYGRNQKKNRNKPVNTARHTPTYELPMNFWLCSSQTPMKSRRMVNWWKENAMQAQFQPNRFHSMESSSP